MQSFPQLAYLQTALTAGHCDLLHGDPQSKHPSPHRKEGEANRFGILTTPKEYEYRSSR